MRYHAGKGSLARAHCICGILKVLSPRDVGMAHGEVSRPAATRLVGAWLRLMRVRCISGVREFGACDRLLCWSPCPKHAGCCIN